jgi:hypothetical protein
LQRIDAFATENLSGFVRDPDEKNSFSFKWDRVSEGTDGFLEVSLTSGFWFALGEPIFRMRNAIPNSHNAPVQSNAFGFRRSGSWSRRAPSAASKQLLACVFEQFGTPVHSHVNVRVCQASPAPVFNHMIPQLVTMLEKLGAH